MRIYFALVFALTLITLPSFGEQVTFKGTLFEKGSNRQKILFQSSHITEIENGIDKNAKTVFTDVDGREALVENLEYATDGSLKSVVLDQKQTGEKGELEIKDKKIYFKWTKNGKTKTDDEKLTPNMVVTATVVPYLQKHWDLILNGKDVDVRFAALDRLETVGFTFKKVAEKKINGKDALVVKMSASSFIISAIVDPLFFTFDKSSKHLIELIGRTAPKLKVGEKWKDLDADITYEYSNASP